MVGVTYRKDRDRWAVQFRKRGTGEFIFVGYHVTKEGAMMMYDQYILDNNMAGYKMNYNHHKKKPYIRKRTDLQSNYDENKPDIPPPLE
jgi:hypothetical protein